MIINQLIIYVIIIFIVGYFFYKSDNKFIQLLCSIILLYCGYQIYQLYNNLSPNNNKVKKNVSFNDNVDVLSFTNSEDQTLSSKIDEILYKDQNNQNNQNNQNDYEFENRNKNINFDREYILDDLEKTIDLNIQEDKSIWQQYDETTENKYKKYGNNLSDMQPKDIGENNYMLNNENYGYTKFNKF